MLNSPATVGLQIQDKKEVANNDGARNNSHTHTQHLKIKTFTAGELEKHQTKKIFENRD